MPHALVLAFLAGCPYGEDDTEIDTDGSANDRCPPNLHRTLNASMTFTSFTVDGLAWFPGFAANSVTNPSPACIDDAGTQLELTFTAEPDVLGTLITVATAPGSFNLVEAGDQVTIAMTGPAAPEPFTTGPNDWTVGGLDVTSTGDRFAYSLNGTSNGGGHTIVISASGEGHR